MKADGSVFVLVETARHEGQLTDGLVKPYSWTVRVFSLGLLQAWAFGFMSVECWLTARVGQ